MGRCLFLLPSPAALQGKAVKAEMALTLSSHFWGVVGLRCHPRHTRSSRMTVEPGRRGQSSRKGPLAALCLAASWSQPLREPFHASNPTPNDNGKLLLPAKTGAEKKISTRCVWMKAARHQAGPKSDGFYGLGFCKLGCRRGTVTFEVGGGWFSPLKRRRSKKKKKNQTPRLGGRERCKAWLFLLLFLCDACAHPFPQQWDCACCSDVLSLPPQREKVPVEESPDLSTLWKINFNSCGGISTKPVNGNWARSWVLVVPILLLPCPENGIIGLLT